MILTIRSHTARILQAACTSGYTAKIPSSAYIVTLSAVRTRSLASSSTSSSSSTSHIPIIDFGKFLHGDQATQLKTAQELVDGFKNVGFVYLANHGIPAETLSKVYDQSKKFFDQPLDEKMKMEWESPESNRGYVAPGREKVTRLQDAGDVQKLREASPDIKESMEIGKEPSDNFQNRWPTNDAAFKPIMLGFYDTAHKLHLNVMSSIALGLGLNTEFFEPFCNKRDHNLRLLHYPTVERSILDKEDQTRAGAHTDYGTITLLFQDDKGGLQVKTHSGEWAEATPIPGTIVVNAGDLLARWSNDVIKSTEHRVVSPPPSKITATSAVYPARYSIAFFCNPNWDAVIQGLPGIGQQGKYPPVKTHDYLVMRLSATY